MASRASPYFFVVTCEHATARVPERYERAFSTSRARAALETHRGVDFGARDLAVPLAERLGAPLFEGTMTRLLVDLNRSPGHPRLFSEYSRKLPGPLLKELNDHHRTYRARLLELLREQPRPIVHLSVHSFTPIFDGVERRTDIGVLYDPKRPGERTWGQHLKRAFSSGTGLVAHANQPYRGVSDGVTSWLRKEFDATTYVGIELEFNQRLVGPTCRPKLVRELVDCLLAAIESYAAGQTAG